MPITSVDISPQIKVAIMAIEQEESKIFEGSLAFWFAESNDELSNKQSDL